MRDVLLVLAAAPVVTSGDVRRGVGVGSASDRWAGTGFVVSADRVGRFVWRAAGVVIALTFIGHAIRDRSSRFAFAAGLLFNAVATMVVLMRLARGGGTLMRRVDSCAQVNAIVAALVALVWEAAVAWYWRGT